MLSSDPKFFPELLLVIADKLFIGLIIAIAGYWLNGRLETLKSELSIRSDIAKERRAYLAQQLSEFYYPVLLRLEKDNAVWSRVLGEQRKTNEKLAIELERTFILPNHEEVLKIFDSHIDLIRDDQELWPEIVKYIRHVAVYHGLRATEDPRAPIDLDEPWPARLFDLIKSRTELVQQEYVVSIPR